MRLVSYRAAASRSWGVLDGDEIIDGRNAARSLRAALELGVDFAAVDGERVAIAEVELLPPVVGPRRIFCVGKNYADHVSEMGGSTGDVSHPTIFTRTPQSLVGHDADLEHPGVSERFDFEGELAVVIAQPGRHIAPGDALAHVGGYTVLMDGSVRDFQRHTSQFTPGKNFDNSGSCGPALVTPDEVGDPATLDLVTSLNGAVVQESNTALMIYDLPTVIAYVSSFTELLPGDVIATGTPSGVGAGRTPPLWMRPGDVLEVEIERVGLLRNRVTEATT